MNNVAYIRALEGIFTTEEWESYNFKELEIQYKESTYEGNEITFMKRFSNDKMIIKGMNRSGEVCVYAILGK